MSGQEKQHAARGAWPARTLRPTASFWFSMLAASALGTNLGDFWADALALGLWPAFAAMAALSLAAIACDLRFGRGAEVFFWIAIVVLRAAATNIADFLTHELAVGFLPAMAVVATATLALAPFATRESSRSVSPAIDPLYWATMFMAGIFGTLGGDFVSHAIGVSGSAGVLCLALLAGLAVRQTLFSTSLVGYWCAVMAERCAGTPVGDAAQGRHGLGLGLPVSMALMGAALLVGLVIRARQSMRQSNGAAQLSELPA